jgi:predicted PurR-regulated permease PerM
MPTSRAAAWRTPDILRAALIVAGVWLTLQLLWVARSVFFLAFLGALFGITLSAGVTWMQKRGVPRWLGTVLLVAAIFGAAAGLGALAAPRISEQWRELSRQLPDALDHVEQWVRRRQGSMTELLEVPTGAPAGAPGQKGGERRDTGGGSQPAAGGERGKPQRESPTDVRQTIAQQVGNLSAHFFTVFSSTLAALGSLLIVTFVAIYIALDPRTYRRGILHLVPHRGRAKAIEVMDAMGVTLRRWLVAQLIGMVIIGTLTTVALLVLDVRAAVALGIIAGILEFVPYFGPILSSVPAIAMGFLDGPEKALWVALAYLVIQQLEGNVVTPLLMKEGLDLPPALTIIGQAVMALAFGFVGLVIAMPLLGAVMVPIKLLYVQDVIGDEVEVAGATQAAPDLPSSVPRLSCRFDVRSEGARSRRIAR